MGRVVTGMSRGRWLLVGGLLVVAVLLLAAVMIRGGPSNGAVEPSVASSPIAAAPTSIASAVATATPTATAAPSATPTPTPTVEPTPRPTPTEAPVADGDPRLLYAEFVLRVNDDRSTVEALNGRLTTAAQAQDAAAVAAASVDILDFVDSERDWLRDHPPARCYRRAHASATAMISAYGDAAERFFDWSKSGGGLAGLDALADALAAAETAGDALTTFGRDLEATSCPT